MKREITRNMNVFSKCTKSKVPREPMRDIHEFAALLGFKYSESVWTGVTHKRLPEPDLIVSHGAGTKAYWKLSTVNKAIQKRAKQKSHKLKNG